MDSLSLAQRLWRLAAAAASLWIAYSLAAAGSEGVGSRAELYARGTAFALLFLYAFGNFVQAIQLPGDPRGRITWFPGHEDRGRLLKVIAAELVLILVVGAIGMYRPSIGGRAVVGGIGVWILIMTLSRNDAFFMTRNRGWDDSGVSFGQLIFLVLGLAIIAAAIFGEA